MQPARQSAPQTRPQLKVVRPREADSSDGISLTDVHGTRVENGLGKTAAILLLLGFGAFFIDLQVSDALNRRHLLHKIHRTLELAEPFGDAAGVLLVAVVIAVLDPARRRGIPVLLLGAFSAGLLADAVKVSVGRIRPNGAEVAQFTSVCQTFTGVFPGIHGGWGGQSFPSAHTTVAWGMAMVLARMYPRGKWLFPIMAGLVGLQRVETGSHYLSDVVFGATIGVVVAGLWLRNRTVSGLLSPASSQQS